MREAQAAIAEESAAATARLEEALGMEEAEDDGAGSSHKQKKGRTRVGGSSGAQVGQSPQRAQHKLICVMKGT